MNRKFFPVLLTSLTLMGAFYFLLPTAQAHETDEAGMKMGQNPMPAMKMETQPTNKVSVTPATAIPAAQTQDFIIKVQSTNGETITQFDRVHEKLMHFIVVSNDLKSFQHLHPEYKGKGVFNLKANLPAVGAYTAFADYTPTGKSQQANAVALDAGQTMGVAPMVDTSFTKTIAGLEVTLALDPKKVKPGVETPIAFNFQDAQGKPVTDLQPYFGAMGHLVVIKYSPKLTAASYLHAHPQEMAGMDHGKGHEGHKIDGSMSGMKMDKKDNAMKMEQSGTVTFETTFPETGLYKMWGQFKRGGKVITADFTISVS